MATIAGVEVDPLSKNFLCAENTLRCDMSAVAFMLSRSDDFTMQNQRRAGTPYADRTRYISLQPDMLYRGCTRRKARRVPFPSLLTLSCKTRLYRRSC